MGIWLGGGTVNLAVATTSETSSWIGGCDVKGQSVCPKTTTEMSANYHLEGGGGLTPARALTDC